MTRLPTLLSLVCLAALTACVPKEIDQFIGRDPKLVYGPAYLVDQDTMQFDESKPSVDWGMSLVWQGDHYVVSADENTTPNKLTQVWKIVAVQDIPLLRQGQMIVMGNCMDDQVPNSRIVAVVDYDQGQAWFDHFEGAWAYDYAFNAFAPYPTEHLLCANPRVGLALDAARPLTPTPLPVIPAPSAITAPVPQPSGG
jgi:hypothetical protein